MKEIKLRAWHEDNQEFIYATIKDIWMNGWQCAEGHMGGAGHHFCLNESTPKIPPGVYTEKEWLEKHHAFMLNADWKLFTGFKDKKGKEIYEGDIIRQEGEPLQPVEWVDCGFEPFVWLWSDQGPWYYPHRCEVIGNIYEHSDLLKGEKHGEE